jgi:hypothetical protein
MVGQAVFWDMLGPAIVGGVFMGVLAILGWRTYLQNLL